jgi:tetratricopeptide (TPR) repeat protein
MNAASSDAVAGASSPSLPRTATPQPGRTTTTTASQLVARASQRFAAASASSSGSFARIDDSGDASPDKQRAEAEEARQRGEMALRREQLDVAIDEFGKAAKLQPQNGAYKALLAWTQFCAASDKAAIANDVRKILAAAMQSTKEPIAQLYLGRVERMLGREKEALRHFREVLEHHPRHSEALSEARVLEGRLANKSSSGGFGKPTKK